MGDVINKLPVDEKLDITNTDKSNVFKFFNADINTFAQEQSQPSSAGGSNRESLYAMAKFALLLTLLYYICSHPASVGRCVEDPTRKLLVQTAVFGVALCVYLYFFN